MKPSITAFLIISCLFVHTLAARLRTGLPIDPKILTCHVTIYSHNNYMGASIKISALRMASRVFTIPYNFLSYKTATAFICRNYTILYCV